MFWHRFFKPLKNKGFYGQITGGGIDPTARSFSVESIDLVDATDALYHDARFRIKAINYDNSPTLYYSVDGTDLRTSSTGSITIDQTGDGFQYADLKVGVFPTGEDVDITLSVKDYPDRPDLANANTNIVGTEITNTVTPLSIRRSVMDFETNLLDYKRHYGLANLNYSITGVNEGIVQNIRVTNEFGYPIDDDAGLTGSLAPYITSGHETVRVNVLLIPESTTRNVTVNMKWNDQVLNSNTMVIPGLDAANISLTLDKLDIFGVDTVTRIRFQADEVIDPAQLEWSSNFTSDLIMPSGPGPGYTKESVPWEDENFPNGNVEYTEDGEGNVVKQIDFYVNTFALPSNTTFTTNLISPLDGDTVLGTVSRTVTSAEYTMDPTLVIDRNRVRINHTIENTQGHEAPILVLNTASPLDFESPDFTEFESPHQEFDAPYEYVKEPFNQTEMPFLIDLWPENLSGNVDLNAVISLANYEMANVNYTIPQHVPSTTPDTTVDFELDTQFSLELMFVNVANIDLADNSAITYEVIMAEEFTGSTTSETLTPAQQNEMQYYKDAFGEGFVEVSLSIDNVSNGNVYSNQNLKTFNDELSQFPVGSVYESFRGFTVKFNSDWRDGNWNTAFVTPPKGLTQAFTIKLKYHGEEIYSQDFVAYYFINYIGEPDYYGFYDNPSSKIYTEWGATFPVESYL